jgi:hypothetical protein
LGIEKRFTDKGAGQVFERNFIGIGREFELWKAEAGGCGSRNLEYYEKPKSGLRIRRADLKFGHYEEPQAWKA